MVEESSSNLAHALEVSIKSALESKAFGPPFSGEFRFNESLSKHTYFRIGGPAACLALPKSISDLEWLQQFLLSKPGLGFHVLGAGSNVLCADSGLNGLVIKTTKLFSQNLSISNDTLVAGSGVMVSQLLRKAATEGLGGLEFLAGIPGTVGGVIAMNAGTNLGEAIDALMSYKVFCFGKEQSREIERDAARSDFCYRKNTRLHPAELIVSGNFRFKKVEPQFLKLKLDELYLKRKKNQPVDYPSCGSTFMNISAKDSTSGKAMGAWQVIDQIGLRGHRVGDAQFSEKHCNFILNLGNAKSADVLELIETAKLLAKKQLGLDLHEEVKVLSDKEELLLENL